MDSDMELTRVMYEGVLGEKADLSTSFDLVLDRLKDGQKGIIVEIPWDETVNGENFDKVKIVLMRLCGGRIYFCNPLPKDPNSTGEVGGTKGKGPERKIEQSGEESMDLEIFRTLFLQGGSAIISENA